MAEVVVPEIGELQTPRLRLVNTDVRFSRHTTQTPQDATIKYNQFTTTAPEDEVPFFVVGGFAGIADAYSPLAESLATLGAETFVIDHGRSMPLRHELRFANMVNAHRLASQGIRAVLDDLYETHGIDQVDAVVHSKAGRDIMWAAHNMPERLRSITFVGSVGLGHNMQQIIAGVPSFITEDGPSIARNIPDHLKNWRNAKGLLNYFLARPHRVVAEIAMIARADIRASLPWLGELGIKTAVLEFANDRLLSPEHTSANIRELTDYYRIFDAGSAGHGAPIEQSAIIAHELMTIRENLHGQVVN